MKHLSDIIEIVSKETGVPVKTLVGCSRKEDAIIARHLSMWACRWHTQVPLKKIALAHGKRNHGTIINASNSIESQAKYDARIRGLCDNISSLIKTNKRS